MVELSLDQLGSRLPLLPRRWSLDWLMVVVLRTYNTVRRSLVSSRAIATSVSRELAEVRLLASTPSDIDEHLELMFAEALLLQPKLIVELGVRGGTSTFVFERAAQLSGASIVSVDVDDCSSISSYQRWHFFQGDDVEFAQSFPEYCGQRDLVPSIDLLFIDTSHYYDHTVREIASWFRWLSPRAKVIFHDTNMRLAGRRQDGCFQPSWQNERGVIRAIEDHLGTKIDERKDCIEYANGWVVRHKANCNGLTILDRLNCQVHKPHSPEEN